MKFEEESTVKAPIESVWSFLLTPEKLAFCVPGCERVEVVSDNSYVVTQTARVGPILAKFILKANITEMTPPNYLLATMEGKESKTGSLLKIKISINLERITDVETRAHYILDVSLAGLLGKFGEGILRAKANSIAAEFANNIKSQLEVPLSI